ITSFWPAITDGSKPDQPPAANSNCSPAHLKTARVRSASKPMMFSKFFGSRNVYGGDSGSTATLIFLLATLGYLLAALSGSHFARASAVRNAIAASTARVTRNDFGGLMLRPPISVQVMRSSARARTRARGIDARTQATCRAGRYVRARHGDGAMSAKCWIARRGPFERVHASCAIRAWVIAPDVLSDPAGALAC